MKVANKKTNRSCAWLSAVLDSFWPGRGEPDCFCAIFPFDECVERWVIGFVPWDQAFWELERR